jgi:uncharacterized protein (TIGR02996 family)
MSVEDAFLKAIDEDPEDEAPRLIYADWLEEHGDPRAEFLRTELAILNKSQSVAHPAALEVRRRELLKALDPEWVALVRRLPLDPIDELRRVLPPPKRPLNAVGNWAEVEQELGLRLPSDYKAFLSSYGSGTAGCIEIVSPLGLTQDVREWWANWSGLIGDLAEYEEVPYPVFPEPGGLLPFGTLGDVDLLTWRTIGDPERWPFVYHDREQGFFEIKGLSAVEFILEAVTQRSPLMIRLGSENGFDPPCEFVAQVAEPRSVWFFHYRPIDLNVVIDRLATHWPPDQVGIRRSPTGATLLIEPLAGRICLSSDTGDERTLAVISYDQRYAMGVEEGIQSLLTEGFVEISREGFT